MPEPHPIASWRSLFGALIEQNADAILIVGADGVIQLANPAAERLLGRAGEPLVGRELGIPLAAETTAEIDLLTREGVRVAEVRIEVEVDGLRPPGYAAQCRRSASTLRMRRSLAEAGRRLAACLEYRKAVEAVAASAVSYLADWCAIDLCEEGARPVPRVTLAHAALDQQALVSRLRSLANASSRPGRNGLRNPAQAGGRIGAACGNCWWGRRRRRTSRDRAGVGMSLGHCRATHCSGPIVGERLLRVLVGPELFPSGFEAGGRVCPPRGAGARQCPDARRGASRGAAAR